MFACLTYLPALVRLHSKLAVRDADRDASAAVINSAISCLTGLKLLHLTCHPAMLATNENLPSIITRSDSPLGLPCVNACSMHERGPEAQRLIYLHWSVQIECAYVLANSTVCVLFSPPLAGKGFPEKMLMFNWRDLHVSATSRLQVTS